MKLWCVTPATPTAVASASQPTSSLTAGSSFSSSFFGKTPSLFFIAGTNQPYHNHHYERLASGYIRRANLLKVQSSAVAIEKETPENERPDTFLRKSDEDPSSVRSRFEKMIGEAQDRVCEAIEAVDGTGKFKEDVWSRPGGGGGISRVLQDGAVWEKAGVNVSVVYGIMPPEAYRAAKGNDNSPDKKPGPVPFFAAGISSVLHPKNPFAPTLHFNYRYFETDAPKDAPGAPRQWWFGGGTDLTPAYIFEEDVKHFHSVQKNACDKFDVTFYPRFKKWCDDYFYIKHRGERRGLGGIFFDDLNNYDQEMLLSFSTGNSLGSVKSDVHSCQILRQIIKLGMMGLHLII